LDHAAQAVAAARELRRAVAGLDFPPPATHVYNPLDYARKPHEAYLRRYGAGAKRVLFVGMNPGPWGMVQTGVPFGEVAAARDWLGLAAPVGRPPREHPKRPVQGFDCPRSEVSGRRLWGLFAERFGTPERFFAGHLVLNYCPLAFLEESGRNLTPDKLPAAAVAPLFAACDRHLERLIALYRPQWLLGLGAFAARRLEAVVRDEGVRVGRVLHPSPASPAANRGWAAAATRQLVDLGVWE